MTYMAGKAPGSFGDKEVLLHFFTPEKAGGAPAVLLLHGVHGWAAPQEGNKYGFLARELSAAGYGVCIAESSRLRRDREAFDDSGDWAKAAFRGKTFAMEMDDARSALEGFRKEFPGSPPVLWGFSLGGLISVLIAGEEGAKLAGIIVSGSGDELRPEAERGLLLPILDSLCDKSELHSAASVADVDFALFFYGSGDESFTEASSRRIFDRLPLEDCRKEFHIVEGADHAFRKKNGVASRAPLEEMLAKARAVLGRY